MADEQNRPVDLVDHTAKVIAVATGQSAQRVRRRD